jgi:hypothetical protein
MRPGPFCGVDGGQTRERNPLRPSASRQKCLLLPRRSGKYETPFYGSYESLKVGIIESGSSSIRILLKFIVDIVSGIYHSLTEWVNPLKIALLNQSVGGYIVSQ